jgi:hypothetical protein
MADETPPPPAPVLSAPKMAPLAIVSVVLAVLSFLCVPIVAVIPAIICGHLAWSRIRKSGGALHGKGIAIVGLIVGYLAIPWAGLQVWFLADMIRSERVRLHDLAVEKKEIASEDGKLKVTTSGFWVQRTDLNNQASLQAAYKSEEMYMIVIRDTKSSLPDMTLPQHHQLTRDHMMQKMTNTSTTEPISTTIDGHTALQDEVTGTTQSANLVFLHTTVDEGDSFDQILAWTLKSRWQKHQQELREVTSSFHREQ